MGHIPNVTKFWKKCSSWLDTFVRSIFFAELEATQLLVYIGNLFFGFLFLTLPLGSRKDHRTPMCVGGSSVTTSHQNIRSFDQIKSSNPRAIKSNDNDTQNFHVFFLTQKDIFLQKSNKRVDVSRVESKSIAMAESLVDLDNRNNFIPPFADYEGETSFFSGTPPLPQGESIPTTVFATPNPIDFANTGVSLYHTTYCGLG
jgi:hypothetical protein